MKVDTGYIKRINRIIRKERPNYYPNEICHSFQTGDLLEIGFISKQCKNDMSGSCLMCDYGKSDKSYSTKQYIEEMSRIISLYPNGINYLLLCSNGSILDEYQIPTETLSAILCIAQNCSIPNIIIETHYKDITRQRLELLKKTIQKPIIIEMGLETTSQLYQDTLFMKGIIMTEYEKTIALIHTFGYKIDLNIVCGLPFLSTKEQLEDTLHSIRWAVEHDCEPVVFPINIKPYTLLMFAYENGYYRPINIWLLIHLLDRLPDFILDKIVVTWYGNRIEEYATECPSKHVILPTTCEKCKNKMMVFFRLFLDTNDSYQRKQLLKRIITQRECTCYDDVETDLYAESTISAFKKTYEDFYNHLRNKFIL